MRSAAKPLQALVSQEAGASLSPRELAVACASHNGEPAHVAMVGSMLAASDLDESALLCPPAWPSYLPEQRRLAAAGVTEPSAVYHNCSGKHAAMLRACVANGWPLSYTDPEHPLQVRVRDLIGEVVGPGTTPTGVDGCGVPTFRVTVGGLAGAYVAVANDPRFAQVATAMHRYPALTSGSDRPEAAEAGAVFAAVKGGAEACIGIALIGQGAVAAKAWDGSFEAVNVVAIEAMNRLGLLSSYGRASLSLHSHPPVLGAGLAVGAMEPM